MGRFALLALVVAGSALTLAPGAGGGAAADHGSAGERLVLAVVGTERSSSAVHGERVVVADPGAGQVRSRRLPGGTLCHGPLVAAGDRVVYTGYRGSRPALMSLPLTLAGPPRPIGRADTMIPSARPGYVWLGEWDHTGKRTRAAFREVAVPGEEATSRIAGALPGRWNHFHAARPGGVVIETRRTLALWDGLTARPLRGGRGAWPVASGGPRFAWCRGRGRLVRVRTPAGERIFRSPAHLRLTGSGGSFSPDGRRLAVAVAQGRRTQAAVLDLGSGDWSMVPGGALSVYGALAWSTAADRLYLASRGGGMRAWRPGAHHTEPLPIDPSGTVMSIAVTGG